MSDIDRYVSTRMLPSASGWNSSGVAHTYVRASDYDALAADNQRLRTALSRAVAESVADELDLWYANAVATLAASK